MSAVIVAATLDVTAGEPPAGWHPVAWMGRYLDRAGRRVPASPPATALAAGAAAWAGGVAGAALLGAAGDHVAGRLPRRVGTLARGTLLWTLCSGRLLICEVAAVEHALAGGLPAGRLRLARIVSRDTDRLTAADVRASALESLAENLSDSVVAPLLWYAVGGLPAAAAYRFANTADAMWGYRTPRWEHAGKPAARADDLLNLLPARLTAALLLLVARSSPRSWRALPAEARRTPSPNGGWPMGALALALDVRLPKPGNYVLHDTGRTPGPADVRLALHLAARAAAASVLLAAIARRALHPHPEGAP